ncbi:hypothetical protein C4D02_RS22080 [Vibrio parahaemolyticus]|nr:hypothetical protein [Vibrio parahaemolyticus]EGR3164367.1 hypothetical protein [Vibrio parahaemolyticus]EJG0321763.1 hypothetical protein [Vibrio parahaemolyticus]EJG0431779.1 hypothetical protein [Vibrio parahaemolyticus]
MAKNIIDCTDEVLKKLQRIKAMYRLFTVCGPDELSRDELYEVVIAMGTDGEEAYKFLSSVNLDN